MATKKPTAEAATEAAKQLEHNERAQEFLTIGELRERKKITPGVFAGACSANEWKPGRIMTEEEFMEGIGKFTGAPMTTPRKKESEAKK